MITNHLYFRVITIVNHNDSYTGTTRILPTDCEYIYRYNVESRRVTTKTLFTTKPPIAQCRPYIGVCIGIRRIVALFTKNK